MDFSLEGVWGNQWYTFFSNFTLDVYTTQRSNIKQNTALRYKIVVKLYLHLIYSHNVT